MYSPFHKIIIQGTEGCISPPYICCWYLYYNTIQEEMVYNWKANNHKCVSIDSLCQTYNYSLFHKLQLQRTVSGTTPKQPICWNSFVILYEMICKQKADYHKCISIDSLWQNTEKYLYSLCNKITLLYLVLLQFIQFIHTVRL